MANYSGKFVLRIPPALHQQLAQQASGMGASLNHYCRSLIESGLQTRTTQPQWDPWIAPIIPILTAHIGRELIAIVVFGSQVRGETHTHSDLDLLIVLTETRPIARSLYRWWDTAIPQGETPDINPHFVHCPTSPQTASGLWFEVALNHVIVYQRGGRITQCLQSLRAHVASGACERIWSHGHPYWVKKDAK